MTDRIAGLKKAAPYIRMYKGKTFVIKAGGEVVGDARALDGLAEQVALLHGLSIGVILVHGGGPQATELSKRLGIPVETVNGRRVTCARSLDVAKMVFNGKLNTDILAMLKKHGVPAVGLSGVDAGLIGARQRPATKVVDAAGGEREVDFGYVGDIVAVNTSVISHLLAGSFVPVVSSMAAGMGGEVLNVNADSIASRLAAAVGAEKLILLTDVPGVLRDRSDLGSLMSRMEAGEISEAIERFSAEGMRVKLEACRAALEGGVPRVHVINGLAPDGLLLEIFTNEGVGTLIERSR